MRLVLFLLSCLVLAPAWALEQVVLQLNWKHQFQFAGYYAAVEQGYFRDAGFAVSLRELQEGGDPVDIVLDGEADFGVAASELALHRAQGKPVVALAAIVQHSPLILLVNRRKVSVIDSLQGSRIMLTPHETELFAYLRRATLEGQPPGQAERVAKGGDDAALAGHRDQIDIRCPRPQPTHELPVPELPRPGSLWLRFATNHDLAQIALASVAKHRIDRIRRR